MKTIESDIDYCKKAILHGSLSFHAASLALPESVRTPCLALYAFCRLADDEVDLKQDKSASIYDLVQRLDLVYAGTPRNHPMDRAFANMVEKFDMPRALPEALFEGFVWDAMSKQYKTFDELISYSARVASSVGVMLCVIMGERRAEVLSRACDLGVAMQLTNIARDIGEDAKEGRLYVPHDWFQQEGLDPKKFLSKPDTSESIVLFTKKLLGKALAKPQSFDFNALNKTIKDLIDKGAMLPLSLKKVAGTVQLKAVNFSETIEDKLLSSVKFTKISEWKPFKRLGKTESLSFKQIKKGKSTETRDIKVYFTAANGGGHIKFRQDPSGPSWKGEYMPVGGAAKGGGISSDKQMAKIWASVDRTAASAFQKAYTAGTNKFKDKKAKIQKDKEKLRKDKFKNTTAYDHYLAIYSSEEVINKTMPIIKNWFKKNTDERDKLVRLIFQVVTSRSPLSARFVIAK